MRKSKILFLIISLTIMANILIIHHSKNISKRNNQIKNNLVVTNVYAENNNQNIKNKENKEVEKNSSDISKILENINNYTINLEKNIKELKQEQEQKQEENKKLSQNTFFDKFSYGEDLPEWLLSDKNIEIAPYTYYPSTIKIKSSEDFYKINKIGIGNTLKEIETAMSEFENLYSVHSPDIPNRGWYYLNEIGDLIIFDFDENDGSYLTENLTDESIATSIIITNVLFFD